MAKSALIGLFILAFAVGCHGGKEDEIWLTRVPDFYRPELKRIAVLPFSAKCGNPAAAGHIVDLFEIELTNNKTYEVYTRQHLKEVLDEQDLSATGVVDAELAKKIGRLGSVQAIICGDVSRYVLGSQPVTMKEYVYVRGGNSYYRDVQRMQHYVIVEASAVVIDTETGRQVGAISSPAQYIWIEGTKFPKECRGSTLIQGAERKCVSGLIQAVAITKSEIDLDGTVLRTATGQYDGKWDWQDRFVPSEEEIHAVVKLPSEAARNSFRLTIVGKGLREILAEQSFVWPDSTEEGSYTFDPKTIVEKHGFGPFTIKLYSGPGLVAWYDFEIARSRERRLFGPG